MTWSLFAVWLRQRRKAVVALVVSIVAALVARKGFHMDTADVELLTSVLTALSVYFVPNEMS